jgi:pimeloyl-ACP methyl ester carboxylesterase
MKSIRWVWRGCALLGAGAAGAALALATRHALETPQPLASGLPGAARIDRDHGGELYYIVAGPDEAPPIVLLHDFYAGASSYEYSGVFARLASAQRVYAPDWLGFGMSERPALAYTGEFYANMLAGYLRDVVARPATIVATGRAANVAARAASDASALFDRLVLISPNIAAGAQLDPTLAQTLARLAQRGSLGLMPYALLSSRPMLRLAAMRRGIGAATEDALDHQWAAAHQFGAQHAVLAALTGELDLPVQHLLPLVEPPILIVAGENDWRQTRDELEELAILHPYADLDIVPGAGAAVCQDQPARFVTAVTLWMQRELPRHVSSDTLRIGSSVALTHAPSASAPSASAPSASAPSASATGAVTRQAPNGIAALRVAPSPEEARTLPGASPTTRAAAPAKPHPAPMPASPEQETPTAKQTAVRKSAPASRPRASAKEATEQPGVAPRMSRRTTRTPKPSAATESEAGGNHGAAQEKRASPRRGRARDETQPRRGDAPEAQA